MTEIKASMAGSMWKMNVKMDDQVQAGDIVAILESMKMEIPIQTDESGTVTEVKVNEGDFINEGDVLVVIS